MIPQLKRGGQQTSQATTLPAAIDGINTVTSLATMKPTECIFSMNILPEDFGMKVREGYREWANGWTGDPARTIISFEGNVDADDKMWVANAEGIWDVSVEGTTAPAQVFTWPSSALNAGICSYVNFTNDGLDRFVLLCDGENGYHIWTQTTDTWAQGSMTGGGIDVELLNFVMVWKERLWFIQRDSALAVYLPPNDFAGNPEEFNFGDQFRFGGSLSSIHNWTLDGGNGIDDYLVALSSSGDVIIYTGTDPADASSFGLVGSWYVGKLPAGNRNASEYSGELYILSVQGLLPMSGVLNGSFKQEDEQSYLTAKVSPFIRALMDTSLNEFGWHVHIHAKQSLLYINSPARIAAEQVALTLYFGNNAWGGIRGLDKSHTANWQGEIFWTDINTNKIFRQTGTVDAVFLDQEADGEPQAIDWQVLSSYQNYGTPAMYKRVQYIRPIFVGNGTPAFNVQAFYDFDIGELTQPPTFIGGADGIWNTGTWNAAQWGGGIDVSDNPRGARGMGRHVAVNIRGRTSEPTTLVAFDIILDSGGMM